MKKIAFLIMSLACYLGTNDAVFFTRNHIGAAFFAKHHIGTDAYGPMTDYCTVPCAGPWSFELHNMSKCEKACIVAQVRDMKEAFRKAKLARTNVRKLLKMQNSSKLLKLFYTPGKNKLDSNQEQYWRYMMCPEGQTLLIRVLERFDVKTTEFGFVWDNSASNKPYLAFIKEEYAKAIAEADKACSWAYTLKSWSVGRRLLKSSAPEGFKSLHISDLPFEIISLIMAYVAQVGGINFCFCKQVVSSSTGLVA